MKEQLEEYEKRRMDREAQEADEVGVMTSQYLCLLKINISVLQKYFAEFFQVRNFHVFRMLIRKKRRRR